VSKYRFHILGLSLALAAVLGVSGPAAGAAPCCGQAGLSPEKRAVAEKLYADFHGNTQDVRRELFVKRRELDAQMYSAQPDEQKIRSLTGEISELRAKLYSARIALKSALIKAGIEDIGFSGYGPGMGRGCPGFGGPVMGRGGFGGYGPGAAGGGCPGMGRGYGPGPGASCCEEAGGPGGASGQSADGAEGQSFGTGSGLRGRYLPGGGR